MSYRTVHNNSESFTELRVSGSHGWVRTRVQSLSLVEVLPGLDLDADGQLSESECSKGERVIVATLARGMHLGQLEVRAVSDGTAQVERIVRDGFGLDSFRWIEVAWQFELAEQPESLVYSLDWFETTSPGHRDTLSASFAGHAPTTHSLLVGQAAIEVPPGQALVRVYVNEGLAAAWSGGLGLVWVCAFVAVYAGKRAQWLGALVASLIGAACVFLLPHLWPQNAQFWRWAFFVGWGWGLLDAHLQTRVLRGWPSALWGVTLGGAVYFGAARTWRAPWWPGLVGGAALALGLALLLPYARRWSRRRRIGIAGLVGLGVVLVHLGDRFRG